MTEPARVSIPRLREVTAAEDWPDRLGESAEEAQARREQAHAGRVRMWDASVPTRFHSASILDLTPEQNPGDRVKGWWETGPLTLVLRSEESGVGKTYGAYAVGNYAVHDNNAWGAAWTMVALNDAFRPGNDPTAYGVAQECDLLVIDDLGRERITDWTRERLQGVLDARWSNKRRTIITTQVPGPALMSRYGDPIVDRVRDDAWIIEVKGRSRRKPAPW